MTLEFEKGPKAPPDSVFSHDIYGLSRPSISSADIPAHFKNLSSGIPRYILSLINPRTRAKLGTPVRIIEAGKEGFGGVILLDTDSSSKIALSSGEVLYIGRNGEVASKKDAVMIVRGF